MSVEVIYKPANKISQESFDINTDDSDSIICDLKRKIFKSQGILPINQRLSLEGKTDNFTIPTRVICNIRNNRNPNASITISGYNQDNYKFAIDTNGDNILDLKFLLSQCIKEKPEYIQLIINNQLVKNNINISNLKQTNNLIFGDNGNARTRYWLEYPSKQIGHGAVHRTSPKLFDIDPEWPTIGHTIRKICRQQPNLRFVGTRKFIGNGQRGEYEWATFKQFNDRVTSLAAGFKYLGIFLFILALNHIINGIGK